MPVELLQRLFAKLDFPDICRLKILSKEWKLSLQSFSSEFTQALKESSPRMLAQVTPAGISSFLLHVLDGRKNPWHESHVYVADGPPYYRLLVPTVHQWVHINGAADVGLVCYVDRNETGLNRIFMINPLTRVITKPPNSNLLTSLHPTMMRIIVDRNTYHYKVIVVNHCPLVRAEVYDSEVQQWTEPKPSLGRIFGIAHYWSRDEIVWRVYKSGPCAYDYRDGNYYDFRLDQKKWFSNGMISYALMEDRLFVLHTKRYESENFICEYHVPENG